MRVMRDSGVEWIGEIPEGWVCCKQKYAMQLLNGYAFADNEFAEDGKYKVLRVGNVYSNPVWYTTNVRLPHDKFCKAGDLLYTWSMSYGPVIWQGDEVIYHYHIWKVVLRDGIDKKYAFYQLGMLKDLLMAELHETTMSFLTMGIMNNSPYLIPPLNEQRRIANYLDARCADIDAISQKVRSEIDLLGEYRKSVIYEAVTKGLDKGVPMQDSGIEWVGEIPEGWEVVPNRTLWSLSDRVVTNDTSVTPNDLLSVSSYYGVDFRKNHLDSDETLMRAPTLVGYRICQPNDLVINIMLAWNGSCGVSRHRGIVSPSYAVFSPNKQTDICPRYYHYLYRTPSCARMFEMHSTGIIKSRLRLYPDVFLHLHSLLPPFDEQRRIADYLDARCADIDAIIAKKRHQLDVLADYRKSLIYECVTGKGEVC